MRTMNETTDPTTAVDQYLAAQSALAAELTAAAGYEIAIHDVHEGHEAIDTARAETICWASDLDGLRTQCFTQLARRREADAAG
jgi:hypothetical protein